MREIKFRGRRSHDKEWVVGNLFIDNQGNKHIVPFSFFEEDGHHPLSFDQETIGQFTGLRDKNGKEIYEGDIVKNEQGYHSVVEYSVKFAKFGTRCLIFDVNELIVIGNIHEIPGVKYC